MDRMEYIKHEADREYFEEDDEDYQERMKILFPDTKKKVKKMQRKKSLSVQKRKVKTILEEMQLDLVANVEAIISYVEGQSKDYKIEELQRDNDTWKVDELFIKKYVADFKRKPKKELEQIISDKEIMIVDDMGNLGGGKGNLGIMVEGNYVDILDGHSHYPNLDNVVDHAENKLHNINCFIRPIDKDINTEFEVYCKNKKRN